MSNLQIATITRSQDYTVIKHNEDNRGFVQQTTIGHQLEKKTEQLNHEVNSSDNTDWQNKKFDAKEKGSNEYTGNGGKKRNQEKKDRVIVKTRQGFDMKI